MTKSQLIAVLILGASLSACSGKDPKPVDCEEGLKYQNREQGKRVVVPEGLDPLNEFAEMPIPKADPWCRHARSLALHRNRPDPLACRRWRRTMHPTHS